MDVREHITVPEDQLLEPMSTLICHTLARSTPLDRLATQVLIKPVKLLTFDHGSRRPEDRGDQNFRADAEQLFLGKLPTLGGVTSNWIGFAVGLLVIVLSRIHRADRANSRIV